MTERKKTGADKLEQNTQEEVAQTNVVEANTQAITCGLIMPIATNEVGTAEHWSQVRTIIEDAFKNTDLKVQMVSESDEVNVIHHNIVTNIYSNDIVICDVSSRNPNVMFELGMRLTFDKPVVIIKDRETPFSFDVGNIQHLEYPRSLNYVEIQKFQDDLKAKTLATLTAAKTKGYSPFLSHYKIKHLSKIDTEEVGREDYIISALNEMKSSINRLNLNSVTSANDRRHGMYIGSIPVVGGLLAEYSKELESMIDDIYVTMRAKHPGVVTEDQFLKVCRDEIKTKYQGVSASTQQMIYNSVFKRIFGEDPLV